MFGVGLVPACGTGLRKTRGRMDRESVELGMQERLDALGFELVELEWAGSRSRPILRVRVDRPDALPGEGITVDDCATVSRDLEPWLEGRGDVPERYVLEVSSPGVDRPLVRLRDWRRFAGEKVVVTGRTALAGDRKRLEGELLGLQDDRTARIRTPEQEEVTFALEDVKRAHLVYDWEASKRGGD